MTEKTLPISRTAFNSRKIGRTSVAGGMIIDDQRQFQDQPTTREPAEGEPVAGRNRGREGDRRRAERVEQRVPDPAAVEVILEAVDLLPGFPDVMEAAERERVAGDELVSPSSSVRGRARSAGPTEEHCEAEQDQRAQRQRGAVPDAEAAWDNAG